VLGFTVAFVLAFEIRSRTTQLGLFLVSTVPLLTSNIIRKMSWIPSLPREGLMNSTLSKPGLIHRPLEFLWASGSCSTRWDSIRTGTVRHSGRS
jgi:putative spermidine/putrescine transport system permease protein